MCRFLLISLRWSLFLVVYIYPGKNDSAFFINMMTAASTSMFSNKHS